MENKISYRHIDEETFFKFFGNIRNQIFSSDWDMNIGSVLSSKEKQDLRSLWENVQNFRTYCIVAECNDEIVGWTFGRQQSEEDYYMINSAVLEPYRRQGVYTRLLEMAVAHIRELGFQHVFSRHKMTNNPVIIPKLQFGFVISGIEVNDRFGTMVRLSYYTNPRRRELMEIRIGARRPDE